MPRYQFVCAPCETNWEGWARITEYAAVRCPTCDGPTTVLLNRFTVPYTQRPSVDNNLFNNAQGVFDEGLGCVVRSRAHREAIMAARGVAEVTRADRESFFQRPAPPKSDPSEMVEALEAAAYQVRYDKLPPPTPIPEEAKKVLAEDTSPAAQALVTDGGYRTVED